MRRLWLETVGLPPPHEEVEAFAADPSPEAWAALVDRCLSSPRFGETWARYWLDVARFAESDGFEHDYDRPHAYHYRDFVIRALNDDMPWDRFVSWQIAGDELASDDPLALMATGFLSAGVFPTQLTEKEFESARYDQLDDMIATTGNAFLGVSLGCARCHDHKYDPISARDYYSLAAVFTTAIRSDVELELDAGTPDARKTTVQVTSEGLPHVKHHADDRGYPHFYPEAYFLDRGDPNKKQGVASAGVPSSLAPSEDDSASWQVSIPEGARTSYRRASLARWMTDVDRGAGALVARVAVNRLWQHTMGRGIVTTPNDFGAKGDPPSHPELLEWLACTLVDEGWRPKAILRLILTSDAWAASSANEGEGARLDPANALWWRHTPRRLQAELIRDAILATAGVLDLTMYGPGTLDQASRRRSVYFTMKRSGLVPALQIFDQPQPLVSQGDRGTTTVAPQALFFANSPQVRSWAATFASRVDGEVPSSPERERALVERVYSLAFSRAPSDDELAIGSRYLASGAGSLVDYCQAIVSLSEFITID